MTKKSLTKTNFAIFDNTEKKLCDYGCQSNALYRRIDYQDNEKFCCSITVHKCASVKKNMSAGKLEINPKTGNTYAKDIAVKRSNALQNKIDEETGLPHYEAVGLKISKMLDPEVSKRVVADRVKLGNEIDVATGLKNAVLWVQERDKNYNSLNPLEKMVIRQDKASKRNNTMRTTLVEYNGEIVSQAVAHRKKIHKTLYEDLDVNGTTLYERQQKQYKGLLSYKETNICYQSSYELEFLDDVCREWGLEWMKIHVTRPDPVKYFCPIKKKIRNYFPDYMICDEFGGRCIYEIKSGWIFNKNGRDFLLQMHNAVKLYAAVKHYKCDTGFFIIDGYMHEVAKEIPEEFKW